MASRSNVSRNFQASRSKILSTGASRTGVEGSSASVSQVHRKTAGRIVMEGVDMTPQSLLHGKLKLQSTKRKKAKPSNPTGASTSQVLGSSESFGSSSSRILSKRSTNVDSESEDEYNVVEQAQEIDDSITKPGRRILELYDKSRERSRKREDSRKIGLATAAPTTDDQATDSSSILSVQLEETPTMMLFELPSTCVAQDSKDHAIVTERNNVYKELCSNKIGSDHYTEQNAQTLNFAQKNKEVMAAPPATRDVECEATNWDIHDSQVLDDEGAGLDNDDTLDSSKTRGASNAKETVLTRHVNEIVAASVASPGCLLDVDGDIVEALEKGIAAASVNAARRRTTKGSSKSKSSHRSDAGNTQNFGASRTNIAGNSSSRSRVAIDASSNSIGGQSSSKIGISSSSIESSEVQPVKATPIDVRAVIAHRQSQRIMTAPTLPHNLLTIERAIQQNIYHARHLMYRDFPRTGDNQGLEKAGLDDLSDPSLYLSNATDKVEEVSEAEQVDSATDTLVRLWGFSCELTKGRTVSGMTWNRVNQDLLAVSYGQFDFNRQNGGLVLFWSLKNPEYPERVYNMKHGVTSLDFSTAHPNLLAVGFYNGVVAIYDIRKPEDAPILESGRSAGTHMDAVWQVQWVDKGSERGESLVSISSDGRVTEWNMKKGLSFADLMLFKRISSASSGGSGSTGSSSYASDGMISRQASGNCIDFARNDSSVYFAGTEDGVIHKCSCSYNEQYLQSYFGHTGPVYRLRVSPFWSNVFISCSADWTVKLWNQNEQSEVLTFHSSDLSHSVNDIAWSPTHSTVFSLVAEDGRIEVWDLEKSTLDPYITFSGSSSHTESPENEDLTEIKGPFQCTSILFAPTAPVLAVGDSTGEVTIYRVPLLTKNPATVSSVQDPISRIKQAIYPDRPVAEIK